MGKEHVRKTKQNNKRGIKNGRTEKGNSRGNGTPGERGAEKQVDVGR
jgi:hypothetical protein